MEENGRIDMSRPTVEMKNIVKMFGSFKANDGINLTMLALQHFLLFFPLLCR